MESFGLALITSLAMILNLNDNVPAIFESLKLFTFPVKHVWYEEADPELIRISVGYLKLFALDRPNEVFLLPRPGCGNGKLQWSDVRPLLLDLPDNVQVVTWQ